MSKQLSIVLDGEEFIAELLTEKGIIYPSHNPSCVIYSP